MSTDIKWQVIKWPVIKCHGGELGNSGVQPSYGPWDETVPESGGARPASETVCYRGDEGL